MQFMFSRKSGIVLAALLGVQLILPASGWALTGRDVALKADQVDTSRTSDMSMAMIIKRGDQQLVRFMAMKKKKFPDSEKQHIRFLEPGDIRNTAYLTWSYRDINKDDDMWVYMPAESLVRRISGGSKKGSFMRSDYANEDISRREVDKDTYTLLPDEALSGVDCHVLEAKAVFPEKTNIPNGLSDQKRYLAARKNRLLIIGEPVQELVFGGYNTGHLTATRQRMRTVGRTKRSWNTGSGLQHADPEDIFLRRSKR
ncbi:MAG: outer membrane lipoprotein-sorting protein [Bilophila wadsworthia]